MFPVLLYHISYKMAKIFFSSKNTALVYSTACLKYLIRQILLSQPLFYSLFYFCRYIFEQDNCNDYHVCQKPHFMEVKVETS